MSKRPYRTEPAVAMTLEGMSPAAIAGRMNVSVNAVRCALVHARRTGRLPWARDWRQQTADRQAAGEGGAMSWTDERVETMRTLWLGGMSASGIASELGAGITRNAVIGKVHRLGISGDRPRGRPSLADLRAAEARRRAAARAKNEARRARRAEERARREAAAQAVAAPPVKPPEPAAPAPVVASTERVTLLGLTASMCRWPLGDPRSEDFRFCGAAIADRTAYAPSYCAGHGRMAVAPRRHP